MTDPVKPTTKGRAYVEWKRRLVDLDDMATLDIFGAGYDAGFEAGHESVVEQAAEKLKRADAAADAALQKQHARFIKIFEAVQERALNNQNWEAARLINHALSELKDERP